MLLSVNEEYNSERHCDIPYSPRFFEDLEGWTGGSAVAAGGVRAEQQELLVAENLHQAVPVPEQTNLSASSVADSSGCDLAACRHATTAEVPLARDA